MTTTIEQLKMWMNTPREGEHLEFKEAKNQYDTIKLYRYCVALANEGGGKFILGVANVLPRKVVGTNAFPNTDDIASKIFVKLHFRVDVEEFMHPDGRVLIFHIPSRPAGTAYQYEGSYLMRSTEDTVSMTEDRLRQIFDEGKPDWLTQIAADGCASDDIVRLLDTQSYFDLLKLPYPATRDAVIDRFQKENLIVSKDGRLAITNLGAILFSKKLDEFSMLERKAPRVVVYDGNSKLKTKLDKVGSKGYAVGFDGLLEFISGQIPSNEVIGKALRQEVKMFPDIAVRELVANALIHQDLSDTSSFVMIEIYSDRMEISNPGKPFIPTERFIDEYRSRNEKLANFMRRFGICEEKGSGIDKVIQASEVYQLPAPDFRTSELRTYAILFAHQDFEKMDSRDRIRACYQHCCLRYVMNEKMTNQSLRERFKLAEKKTTIVSQVITKTLENGKIKLDEEVSTTSRKYARYIPYWA